VSWLEREACCFGYRESIFKQELRDKVVVTALRLNLSTTFRANLGYAVLADHLAGSSEAITASRVLNAVCEIRRSKLPDPRDIPNAGSFFKNPSVDSFRYEELKRDRPDLIGYQQENGMVKLAAAQLIDRLGWKGFMDDGVGVHSEQALVLINPGRKAGSRVLDLAKRISGSVLTEYGIELEIEPRVIV
jgi:UDP-N-acetylmuramate dehydrogenase